ncbi:hypothetical protein AAFF_G00236190 [Aldrovandia affinis]|uniref:Uncharacterized protein n=1 Tax=Aldrovandia affinis TaxID=143900 RepID=A0AAD7W4R7_9TELE|nr:hypothetical protein AAFF_G00236190 [Aldrovandia affinis]
MSGPPRSRVCAVNPSRRRAAPVPPIAGRPPGSTAPPGRGGILNSSAFRKPVITAAISSLMVLLYEAS